MPADIKLNFDKGYWDFSFEDGDFVMTDGMETALLLSIFCEKRAGASEIPSPELRRGWWGNSVLGYDNYEMGSKNWLLEQARKDNNTLNLAKTYTLNALQWLVDDGLAKSLNVDAFFIVGGVSVEIEIFISLNKIINTSYELWSNTNLIKS